MVIQSSTSVVHNVKPLYEVDPASGEMSLNFHAGQLRAWDSEKRIILVLAGSQSGKALDVDTPIATPSGFKHMGDLCVGDHVFDKDGNTCEVLYTSPVYVDHKCYRVFFDDGSSIVADAEHLWVTSSLSERKAQGRGRRVKVNGRWDRWQCCKRVPYSSIRTTETIKKTLNRNEHTNHSIDLCGILDIEEVALPVAPYTFGVWLGDGAKGTATVCSMDKQILLEIEKDGYAVGPGRESNSGKALSDTVGYSGPRGGCTNAGGRNKFINGLRLADSFCSKNIPKEYLWGSPGQRLAFLQGLMDTDGWCEKEGECCFANTRKWLTDAVVHLAKSLGVKVRRGSGVTAAGTLCYSCYFYTRLPVFRLQRKLDRQKEWKRRPGGRSKCDRRFIVSVEDIPSVPVRCITVDSPSHTYLAGESLIPTHNTSFGPFWLSKEIQLRGPGDYLVVAPTFKLLSLKLFPEFLRLFRTHCKWGDFTGRGSFQSRFLFNSYGCRSLFGRVPEQATQVFFGHAQDPDSLESATAKGIWLDEAGQRKFRVGSWEAVQRRGSIHQARVLLTTTPYTLGWLKDLVYSPWKKCRQREELHPYIDVIQFKSIDNPCFPKEEYERTKSILPTWKHRMFYDGEFERPAGVIYEDFDYDECVIQPFDIPETWPRYVGLDFGGVHTAGTFFAEGPDPLDPEHKTKLFLYREYPSPPSNWQSMTATGHVQEILKGEKSKPKAIGGASSEGQWREEFRAGGLYVHEPPIKEVEVGIDRVIATLKRDELRVFSTCTGVIDEFQSYSRVLDDLGNPTEKIEDKETYHRLDSVRYAMSYMRGVKKEFWMR